MRPESSESEVPDEPASEEGAPSAHVSRQEVERLFRRHNEALLCFINARLHSWVESKDVAQEAYVKLLGLDQRAVSYLQAYLYKIAGNLVADRMRQRQLHTRHEHFMFFDAGDRERDIPSAEAESIRQQEREQLERLVAELPPRCRLVFTLVELEGKPVKSVAAYLQIKPESVRQFVHRAYEYLGEAMTERLSRARGPS